MTEFYSFSATSEWRNVIFESKKKYQLDEPRGRSVKWVDDWLNACCVILPALILRAECEPSQVYDFRLWHRFPQYLSRTLLWQLLVTALLPPYVDSRTLLWQLLVIALLRSYVYSLVLFCDKFWLQHCFSHIYTLSYFSVTTFGYSTASPLCILSRTFLWQILVTALLLPYIYSLVLFCDNFWL